MDRYSAKLLFQFRVEAADRRGKRRLCEERIVAIQASDPQKALAMARRYGKNAKYSYTNDKDNAVHFEFVGVMELIMLGVECDINEVWYEMRDRLLPMERKDRLIPPESGLSAISNAGRETKRP